MRPSNSTNDSHELSVLARAEQYQAQEALYSFDFLVVPEAVREDLLASVHLLEVQHLVFEDWNLKTIEPFPQVALNFYGPPGTGKTLAAHAIAHRLKRKILFVTYAQIESKFLGEGSKNVEAVFFAAERDDAVLFIDEADSLLSKRLPNVQQGSEHAINSMRSQLLICLGRFKGTVIFATNFVEAYDRAFESRMRHTRFELPDQICRQRIWEKHLVPELPRACDVTAEELAKIKGICGRDIKNAIVDAARRVAYSKRNRIELSDLISAVERLIAARPSTSMQKQLGTRQSLDHSDDDL